MRGFLILTAVVLIAIGAGVEITAATAQPIRPSVTCTTTYTGDGTVAVCTYSFVRNPSATR